MLTNCFPEANHVPLMYPSYTPHVPLVYPSCTPHVPLIYPTCPTCPHEAPHVPPHEAPPFIEQKDDKNISPSSTSEFDWYSSSKAGQTNSNKIQYEQSRIDKLKQDTVRENQDRQTQTRYSSSKAGQTNSNKIQYEQSRTDKLKHSLHS
jgi:hypothetical protein